MAESPAERTLLVKNARVVVTMDDRRRELAHGAVYIRGRRIAQVGPSDELPATADEVLDATGHAVLPGLVNTHHHMYQTLTRAIPAAQDCDLFTWLKTLYPLWARLTPDMARVSAQIAMVELMLSGCTTSSDHLYLYPNGVRLEDTIEAAKSLGMRFHAMRGGMSLGESAGGLPPDSLVETEEAILADALRAIEAWHDADRYAMVRVGVAPCSPFSVSDRLMRSAADLARAKGVRLHTHLAENDDDVRFSRERYGMTPAQYAESLGWVGDDVWHAHCVKLDAAGIDVFARTCTGVAHCPSSNMRLASGIAPVRTMLDAGVRVGLGVDGSASNDGGHMLGEARQALLLSRVSGRPDALGARRALELATLGGARVLGRDDIGSLAPGMAADLVAFDLRQPAYAGALHDPVAALLFSAQRDVAFSVIDGRVVVREGRIVGLDVGPLVERHNRMAHEMVTGTA